MANHEEGVEPMHKKQKCGEVVPSLPFGGGPMYDEATARKMLKEVLLIDADSEAYGGEGHSLFDHGDEVIGFDPDDAALDNVYEIETDFFGGWMTPLIYFARKGDLKMCGYLVSRGASTTKSSDVSLFPMKAAAQKGHLEICKLLYANGAQNDVRRRESDGSTSFTSAALYGHVKVVRWLTLHGALCADSNSKGVDERTLEGYHMNGPVILSCYHLIAWAEKITQSHYALITFLGGMLPPDPADAGQRCILQCLSGHPGVRKNIGDYFGLKISKRKHLGILRSVVAVLPAFVKSKSR